MPRRIALLVLVSAVVSGLLLAWLASRTPAPRPADAPATTFSAQRAMDDVRAVARAPHPTGSPENRRVRDYLVARLRSMGLQVRTADSTGIIQPTFHERYGTTRPVSNIVAVLPGRNRTLPAVMLMSHYDARDDSPGAADDAAGVAASLEIARAVQASGPPPLRDLVLLITDGEELGLIGAFNFFDHPVAERRGAPPDPLARRIGVVLNMEARGGGGRSFMFETSDRNGGLVGLYGREAVRPSSTSLAIYLYALMSNATDFSVSRLAGVPGLNWAFIGRPAQYHEPSSTPENLDVGSLQHTGDQVLPVARALLAAEQLPGPTPNAVYSDVLGTFLIAYPPWAGWLVLAAAFVLAALAWRRPPRLGDAALGFVGALGVVFLSAILLRVLLLAVSGLGVEILLENFGLLEIGLGLACALGTLLVFALLARGRNRSVSGVWFGFVLFGLLAATALQILEPTTAHTVAWPLLLTCAAAVLAARRLEAPAALVAVAAASALVIGQVGEWAHGVALGVGFFMPEPLAAFALLAILPLAPLLLLAFRRRDAAS